MNTHKGSRLGGIAAALMLVAGATGCGAAAPPANAGVPASVSASAHHHKRTGIIRVRGQVASLTAHTIAVTTRKGRSLTFAITSVTKYRKQRAPILPSAVPLGATVVVVAKRNGGGYPQAVVVRLVKP